MYCDYTELIIQNYTELV